MRGLGGLFYGFSGCCRVCQGYPHPYTSPHCNTNSNPSAHANSDPEANSNPNACGEGVQVEMPGHGRSYRPNYAHLSPIL